MLTDFPQSAPKSIMRSGSGENLTALSVSHLFGLIQVCILSNYYEHCPNNFGYISSFDEMSYQEIKEVLCSIAYRNNIKYETYIGKKVSEYMNSELKSEAKYLDKLLSVFGNGKIMEMYFKNKNNEEKEKVEENNQQEMKEISPPNTPNQKKRIKNENIALNTQDKCTVVIYNTFTLQK